MPSHTGWCRYSSYRLNCHYFPTDPAICNELQEQYAYLNLRLYLLSPSQFLGLGDGCGQKLGFKGWLGSISNLLLWALSSDLLGS